MLHGAPVVNLLASMAEKSSCNVPMALALVIGNVVIFHVTITVPVIGESEMANTFVVHTASDVTPVDVMVGMIHPIPIVGCPDINDGPIGMPHN